MKKKKLSTSYSRITFVIFFQFFFYSWIFKIYITAWLGVAPWEGFPLFWEAIARSWNELLAVFFLRPLVPHPVSYFLGAIVRGAPRMLLANVLTFLIKSTKVNMRIRMHVLGDFVPRTIKAILEFWVALVVPPSFLCLTLPYCWRVGLIFICPPNWGPISGVALSPGGFWGEQPNPWIGGEKHGIRNLRHYGIMDLRCVRRYLSHVENFNNKFI